MGAHMQARDIMTTRVITVGPDTEVAEIAKCLLENRISAVPVIESDGRLLGIVSEGDLMRRSESGTDRRRSWWLSLLLVPQHSAIDYIKTHGRRAREVMTSELITANDDTRIEEVAEILEKHRIKRVPVIHDGKLVGIVSRANLLHGLVARQTDGNPSIDDRKIKAAVEKNLSDAGVRIQLLNLVVSNGVARIWGIVTTPEEQVAARIAAESAPAVKEVRANVQIIPFYMRPFVRAS
jgi:CBS domain-containing protein